MNTLVVILAIIAVVLGLGLVAFATRRSEQRTLTFSEPVRRAEVELWAGQGAGGDRAGAVGAEGTSGDVDLRTRAGQVTLSRRGGCVRATYAGRHGAGH